MDNEFQVTLWLYAIRIIHPFAQLDTLPRVRNGGCRLTQKESSTARPPTGAELSLTTRTVSTGSLELEMNVKERVTIAVRTIARIYFVFMVVTI
jgi:hypothetical protein